MKLTKYLSFYAMLSYSNLFRRLIKLIYKIRCDI